MIKVVFRCCLVGALALSYTACRRPPTPARGDAPPITASPTPSEADIPAETAAQRGTHLALLYSADLQGEYENCGCPSHPLGGLARRATAIDQARAETDGVLVVDAGDLLLPERFGDPKQTPPDAGEVLRRARLMVSAYARMGLAALLPAERDLALGPARLKDLLKAAHVPAVASNLTDAKGRALFPRDRIVEVAGIPIGIFGVVAAQPEDAALWRTWKLSTTDPVAVGREEVASLRARGAKMIVALVHLGPLGAASAFLEAVPGIDWAVQGHTGMQLQPPSVIGGARLVDAMSMGKLVGRLDIHVVDGAFTFKDRGARAQALAIIADHRQQLADLEKRAAGDKSGQLKDFYQQRRQAIGGALARELEGARQLPARVDGSWYEGRILPLDESWADHRGIALLVAAYNAETARRAAAGLPVGIALRDPAAPKRAVEIRPEDIGQQKITRYAGSLACASCHPSAWRVFETTKHAHALATLAAVHRERDPTCIGCHTTGFMLPGGTWSVDAATQKLKEVGCESCHGPSLGHISLDDKKSTTRRMVPETICRGCHTPQQTNGEFAYQPFLKAIIGPGHGAPEALR